MHVPRCYRVLCTIILIGLYQGCNKELEEKKDPTLETIHTCLVLIGDELDHIEYSLRTYGVLDRGRFTTLQQHLVDIRKMRLYYEAIGLWREEDLKKLEEIKNDVQLCDYNSDSLGDTAL